MIQKSLGAVAVTAAIINLSGCALGTVDLKTWIAEVKARKNDDIQPIPAMKPYEAFTYESAGVRDPFTIGQKESMVRPDANRPHEPLEDYPIDSLRLNGVAAFEGRDYAMIKTPEGVVHRVVVGNYVGQNFGRVMKIDRERVVLSERYLNAFNEYVEREAVMPLAEGEVAKAGTKKR